MYQLTKILLGSALIAVASTGHASATCTSYPYTLTNGSTADASQVMANFNCAALTSGATLNGTTFSGSTSFPGSTSISSSGSIGIGTISPMSQLDIENAAGPNVILNDTGASPSTGIFNIFNSGGALHFFRGQLGVSAIEEMNAGTAGVTSTGINLQNISGGVFSGPVVTSFPNTGPSYVNNGSNVGIGTTTPAYTLHVNGSVAGTSAYNNLSDVRLKKDIHPIDDPLSIVTKLRGVRFTWRTPQEREVGKSFNLPVNDPQIGFIAQDLAKVLPEAVSIAKNQEAVMSVAESKVVPVLVEAIKKLKAINDGQASEIKDMELHLAKVEKRVGLQSASR